MKPAPRTPTVIADTPRVRRRLPRAVRRFDAPRTPPLPMADASADAAASERGSVAAPVRLMLIVFGLSGFASLALEVIWFRILVLFLPATTYAFTTMLATVLFGLAAGGWIAARLLRRDRDWMSWLTTIQIATGLLIVASLVLLSVSYAKGWGTTGTLQASVIAILPASLLMGVSFPIGLRIAAGVANHGSREVAHRLGTLYSVNVLGAILGSTLAGFLLLPRLGSRVSLIVCAALYLAAGLLLVPANRNKRNAIAVSVAGVVLFAFAAANLPDPFRATLARRHGKIERLLWHDEGIQTTVAVHSAGLGGHTLYLDGLHQANDTAEMLRVHRQIGHLAVMLHPAPKDVLVIGLGGGVTAGAASQHPVKLDIVELSDGVRQAARFFSHVNYDVLRQPNVHLRVDDGRSVLARRPNSYDVITADIIQPIHAGAGHLYSVEYFRLARETLRDDGVMLQWVGHRSRTQYELIVRTFLDGVSERDAVGRWDAAGGHEEAAGAAPRGLRASDGGSAHARGERMDWPDVVRHADVVVHGRPADDPARDRPRPDSHRRSSADRVSPLASGRRALLRHDAVQAGRRTAADVAP